MTISNSEYGPQPVFRLPFAPGQRWGASGSHADSDGIHRGAIDFAPLGSSDKSVRAIAAGVVYRVSCSDGWFLGVDHGGGWMSEYYHLTRAKSGLIGKWVEAGTHLGDAGQTLPCGGTPGSSAHVHLSILNEATDVPSGMRKYVSVSGIQFDGYTLQDSSGAYNGVWRNLGGDTVLTSRGVTCCLRASSRIGPSSPQTSLPDANGNGIVDYSEVSATSTDLDLDGRTDIVAFGDRTVYTARSTGNGFGGSLNAVDGFAASGGWERSKNPRLLVDVTGDSRPDIVGFADRGVYVSIGNGRTFAGPRLWIADFGVSRGWRVGTHARAVVDVTGDDLPDIVGFGNAGVYVARNTGSSFAPTVLWARTMGSSSTLGSWRDSRNPRAVVDVTGDGLADLVGFGNKGVYVAENSGNGFTSSTLWVRGLGVDDGWTVPSHPRYVTDVTGDGRPDVIGFGSYGVWVARNTGSSFATPTRWSTSFGTAQPAGSWKANRHSRALADVNADGLPDIVGFGTRTTYVALNRNGSFASGVRWTDDFNSTEWSLGWMPRSLADVNGDGRADIVGFADDGVHVALSTGSRFGAAAHWSQTYGYGSYADGWRVARHPRAITG